MNGSTSGSHRLRLGVVLSLGFFALVAQTLMFRRFLTVYEGNELGIGCFFSSWLVWVALGALLGRMRGRWAARLVDRFELLPLLYLPAFVLQQALTLHSRALSGIEPYEMFPFTRMFPLSLAANAPVSLVTGLLFALACRWTARDPGLSVARVYMFECLGSFTGGVFVTLALAAGFGGETIFLWTCWALALALALYRLPARRYVSAFLPVVLLTVCIAAGAGRRWSEQIHRSAWRRLLPPESYAGSFTTAQAEYLYGEYRGQFNVLAWESVAESIPNDEYGATVVAAHLAQKPDARRILVIGSGALPVCHKLLQLPGAPRVTWLHPDPEYGRKLSAVLPETLAAPTRRLEIPDRDAREFIQRQAEPFDLVILALPDATTLGLNRYFTREFLLLLRERLAPGGVVSVRSSGGENFMGSELVNLGASLLATLESVFGHVVLKPGDETWFMAAREPVVTQSAAELGRRFAAIEGARAIYPPEAVEALYLEDRAAFQMRSYREAVERTPARLLLNTDRRPKAMLHSILFVGRHAGTAFAFADRVRALAVHGWPLALLAITLYGLLRCVYLLRSLSSSSSFSIREPTPPFDNHFLIFAVGLTGLALNVVLMFMFQSRFGSIFLYIGLVSSLYMLGLFAGGIGCERYLVRRERVPGFLLPACLGAHLALLLLVCLLPPDLPRIHYAWLFPSGGLIGGLYVPLAALNLRRAGFSEQSSGSAIEMADHLGGAAGGLLAGLLLLPIFGTAMTLAILAALLAVNGLPLAVALVRAGKGRAGDRMDHVARALGYVLFGIAAFLLISARVLRAEPAPAAAAGPLKAAAEQMASGFQIEPRELRLDERPPVTYFAFRGPDGSEGFVFSTEQLAPGISGFGGPIVMAVMTDRDGRLLGARIVRSAETTAYMGDVQAWLDGLKGRNIFEREALAGVDGVTGATISSTAIVRTLQAAGSRFASVVLAKEAQPGPSLRFAWKPDRATWALAVLLVAALVLRARPARVVRRVFLLAVVVAAGFVFNLQYSLDQVLMLLGLQLPGPGLGAPFVVAVLVPVLVVLLGNVYCGYLCPFGALQELMGDIAARSLRRDPDPAAWRWGRYVKYLLLFAVAVLFALTAERGMASADPLVSAFSGGAGRALAAAAGAALVLSLFYGRFWCRNLCPAGAFLALLNRIRLLRPVIPKVPYRLCDYGVRSAADLDCICCDRCRAATRPEPQAGEARAWGPREYLFLAVVLVFAGWWLNSAWTAAARAARAQPIPARELVLPPSTTTQPTPGVEPGLAPKQGQARDADAETLRRMIAGGRLSDHEALYYGKAAEMPSAP